MHLLWCHDRINEGLEMLSITRLDTFSIECGSIKYITVAIFCGNNDGERLCFVGYILDVDWNYIARDFVIINLLVTINGDFGILVESFFGGFVIFFGRR